MKVYVVRDSDFTTRDGSPASYLLHYEAYAKRFLSAFDEVVLVGRLFSRDDPTAKPVTGPGVTFVPLPGYRGPLGFLKALPKILSVMWRTLDRDAAYILRVPATIPLLYSVLLRLRGIPFAVEVAADPYDGYSRQALGNHPLASIFRALFVRVTRWQCRTALASAYVTREALQRRYPPRSAESTFAFTSIDLGDDAFARTPRGPASFDISAPRLVMIGNMQKLLKGHDLLFEALARLRADGVMVRATIIGFGENRGMLEAMAKELGLADHVHFTGKLANGAPVREVLDQADMFVLPSRQEGLPRALLEAMARALPAVASRVGGTPELLGEDSLFDSEDIDGMVARIRATITDPKALSEMSSRNLAVARTYHVDVVRRARTDFYRFVAGGSGAAAARA